jgi:hypothetical protein
MPVKQSVRLRDRLVRAVSMVGMAVGIVAATLVGASPAQAATSYVSYFIFDKNWEQPNNSTLTWRVYKIVDGTSKNIETKTWRAGSGLGVNNHGTDECYTSHGWLPNGTYSMRFDHDYNGTKIWGYVFALSNKTCAGGSTTRDELFVHSEMTSSGGQYCPTSKDDPQCWEGAGDYSSEGCIKLSPADVKAAAAAFLAYNSENVTYSSKLFVTD